MIQKEMCKIDDYSEGEIQRPEDAAGVCDVEQGEGLDRKRLSGAVGNAEDLISLCESTHHLESKRYRLLDTTHANEKIQTAAQNINVLDDDVIMCSSKTSASAAEENLTRDLHTSVAAVTDAAASARAFDQESIELLEQRGCIQDIIQLSNYETRAKSVLTCLNDNRLNTIDLSIEEFRASPNEDCLETENSSTFSSGKSTVKNDTFLSRVVGVVDFEVQQPPILDSIASSSLSVVSSGSGANSIVLNEVETVTSLKVQLKRAQRGLIALTSKRVTSTNRLLEISALQDELEESETKRRDNENALRTVRKELLTAQWKLSEALGSAERNIIQDQDLELDENALLDFKMIVREKEETICRLKDANIQLEKYCKHDISEFKEKFLNVLHSVIEEKKNMEVELASLTLKLSRSKGVRERENGLLKAAMYHLGQQIVEMSLHDAAPSRMNAGSLSSTDLTEDLTRT